MSLHRLRLSYESPYGGASLTQTAFDVAISRVETTLRTFTRWKGGVVATLVIDALPHTEALYDHARTHPSPQGAPNCTATSLAEAIGPLSNPMQEAFATFGDAWLGPTCTLEDAPPERASLYARTQSFTSREAGGVVRGSRCGSPLRFCCID